MSSGKRLLFASYHCYVDPSSGAAVSTRELLRLLSQAGWSVRALCGPRLDFTRHESIAQLLADEGIAFRETASLWEGLQCSVLSFADDAIESKVLVCGDFRPRDAAPQAERLFVSAVKQVLDTWRPEVLLTYGGDRIGASVLSCAHRSGTATVFWLQNLAYRDGRLFDSVDRIVVPSQFAASYYDKTLGCKAVALPCLMDWLRVTCTRSEGQRYITFVNPQPAKGVFVFARIAEQLQVRRPDIPLLIVEGRSGVEWLRAACTNLGLLRNLHVMDTTPDPRDFYRVSHAMLVPSLCQETFGRVAAEAMINGIPVLASNRGALPEVLGDAGFLFEIPACYTPETRTVATAEEVAPWVDAIIRLWDNTNLYEESARHCRKRAEAWRTETLLPRYEEVLQGVMRAR